MQRLADVIKTIANVLHLNKCQATSNHHAGSTVMQCYIYHILQQTARVTVIKLYQSEVRRWLHHCFLLLMGSSQNDNTVCQAEDPTVFAILHVTRCNHKKFTRPATYSTTKITYWTQPVESTTLKYMKQLVWSTTKNNVYKTMLGSQVCMLQCTNVINRVNICHTKCWTD